MKNTITLSAGWKIDWTEFRGNRNYVPELNRRLDAMVPGDVHLDLMRCGKLDDPFVGMNSDSALWIEHKDWWYRCEFGSPKETAGRQALLAFHGLDCFATVWPAVIRYRQPRRVGM